MHLRAIKLRGFKSFPEAVEVRLEPGVAVVVGPNGSGKSNVADALLWASGSLSPHELRAEKPDDVLFAGSPGHAPADFCEVELLFDNEDGALPELDFSEVSVTRRLHRGGEGQYLINRAAVRRTDLVELLADVGLGGSHGSVISQGKVEEILASKPEERRALIEDAAGLGKFKRRRHRAELKLARVGIQVERARDLEAEVKARLRPLALQATAAERAEKLRGEIAGLRARLAELDLAGIDERLAEVEERRAAAGLERKRTGERLEALLAERNRVEEELAAAAGRGDGATSALYRLRSAVERLELRRDAARELCDRLRAEPLLPRTRANPEREALQEQARLARERLAALEHSLAEREGLPPAARALAEEGERLALSLLEVDAGYERAVAAALARRAAALVAADAGRRAGSRRAGAQGRARRSRGARAAARGAAAVAAAARRRGAALEPRARAVRAASVSPSCWPTSGSPSQPSSSGPRAGCSSRAKVIASTPTAASSGSPARPRRRCCCSSTRAAARWPPRPTRSSAAPRSCPPRRRPCQPARWSTAASIWRPSCRGRRARPRTSRRRCGRGSMLALRVPASWPRSCAGSGARRPRSGASPRRPASAQAESMSSVRASRPRPTRRDGGSRTPEPSPPRATTARSSPRGSSDSIAAARRSGRSTRWPRRSTTARRSA